MTTRPKVVVYTEDPDEGGVAVYAHALLCGLAAAGYPTACVQTESAHPNVARRRELGVQHHWLGYHTRRDHVRNATDTTEPARAFDAARPDVVVFANCSPFSHVAAKAVAASRGIPFIVVEGYVATYDKITPDLAWHLYYLDEQYKQSKAVVAVSQENLDLLHRLYKLPKTRGEIIHYGRPAEFFEPRRADVRSRLRDEHGIPPDAVACLTVARLEAVKGYQFQFEALKLLQQTPAWEKLYFVWIGPGSMERELTDAVSRIGAGERVKILGQRHDVADWLDAADVFLLPSLYEGMPLAVMEAMGKGLPVVATAVSGIPEELGDAGKLLPSPHSDSAGVAREIAAALSAWVADPAMRARVGEAGRIRANVMFREERMVHQTIQVIERARLPVGDYVSPGFEVARPDAFFPNMKLGDAEKGSWQYLRRGIPHNWYVDGRAPDTGFANRDEAHILYNYGLLFRDQRALEIGCWLGWSVCHLALGGVSVDVIDPVIGRPDFRENIEQSLNAAGVNHWVNLIAGFSPAQVHDLARLNGGRWALMFIDGNHEPPYPVFDAAVCAELAAPDAAILFHDLASPHVADGLEYLRQCGWNVLVYMTAQIMGVAWRGNIEPLRHRPDPAVAWHVPDHIRKFPISGMTAR